MEGIIEMWSLCLKDKSAILNPTKKKKKISANYSKPHLSKMGLTLFWSFPVKPFSSILFAEL